MRPTGFARRRWLQAWAGTALGWPALQGAAWAAPDDDDDTVAPGRGLRFPRDPGAHLGAAIEWWYATGWLAAPTALSGGGALPSLKPDTLPGWGFQLTFFRTRTPVADAPASQLAGRFAPRQLLFAHAAVSDLGVGRHRHAQRLARWSGSAQWPEAQAALADTQLALGSWRLQRQAAVPPETSHGAGTASNSLYQAQLSAPEAGFSMQLSLQTSQPLLLQGEAGFSRKGPAVEHASHYYTQPQLRVQAQLQVDGQRLALQGRGWLDHEWSHALLAPGAVGWDWIGINLHDGGALTAFVLRRADGSVLWAGGSHRAAGQTQARNFGPQGVQFTALAHWTSPDTGARYPVQWRIDTPVGRFSLKALLDAQEMDSRASTGAVYWEGLAELRLDSGAPAGLGYLEMTGRAGALRLTG
jgi:predicted secreted hydrolase